MSFPSNKKRMPWHKSPAQRAQAEKLKRLKAKGLAEPIDKAAAREMCANAARSHKITRIPARRKRTRAAIVIDRWKSVIL